MISSGSWRQSRDPEELLARVGGLACRSRRRCAQRYSRMVTLANQGAREMGFADVGAMWRSNYDMPPEAFCRGDGPALATSASAVRFPARLRRWKLAEKYGHVGIREDAPDSRAPAGKYVGAGLDEHLSAGSAGERPILATT